jgi:hypothetical protein
MDKNDVFMGRELIYPEVENTSELITKYMKINTTIYCGECKFMKPAFKSNTFHAMVAIDPSGTLLTNSNSFLVDPNFVKDIKNHPHTIKSYDYTHTIFTRILRTFNYIQDADSDEEIEQEMFLLCNSFSGVNIGHELSIMFDRIVTYRKENLSCPVVLCKDMLRIQRAYEIIKLLLPSTTFYFIDDDKLVHFKKLWITPNEVLNITKHPMISKEVIEKALEHVGDLEPYKNRKIFLVKNNSHKNIVTTSTAFSCERTKNVLETEFNYVCINPEVMPIYEIVAYLYHASKIVTSFGGILYGNAIFFNPKDECKRYFLSHTIEDVPYWDKEKYVFLKTPCLDLDAHMIQLLYDIGEIHI